MKARGFIQWICESLKACLRKLRRSPHDRALEQSLSSAPVKRLHDHAFFILETSPPLPRSGASEPAQKIIKEARDRFEQGHHFQGIASEVCSAIICGTIIEQSPNLGGFFASHDAPQTTHVVKILPAA